MSEGDIREEMELEDIAKCKARTDLSRQEVCGIDPNLSHEVNTTYSLQKFETPLFLLGRGVDLSLVRSDLPKGRL